MCVWTDTHCHLNHPLLASEAVQLWSRARQEGVQYGIVVGYDLASSEQVIPFAQLLPDCFAAVGIHPHDALQCNEEALAHIRQLAVQPRVVAIGEIGLDYYRNLSPRSAQQKAFEAQLQLAVQLRLPVIIHCRDAYDDLLDILDNHPLRGVLHCFSGERRHAQRALDKGWYIGIGGVVTFKNATGLHEIVRSLPLRHLLLETDAPYLAPVPHRGQRNEPAYIPLIGSQVAALKNLAPEQVAEATTQNALNLFPLRQFAA